MNKPFLRLLFFLILLFAVILSGCGVDLYLRGRGHVEIVHFRPYDTYGLKPIGSDIGCSYGFQDFLDENYGLVLKPTYNYITLSQINHNLLEVWIEDVNISVIADYDHLSDYYYGIWDNTDFIFDCQIGEIFEIWIEDTGHEIFVDVINLFDNSAFDYSCPLNDMRCENIISFVGYPI